MNQRQLPTSFEGQTFLVAGAAGFVPSTTAEFYLKGGAKVVGVDNFVTGSHSNIELLSQYPNFEFIEGDITADVTRLKKFKFDHILSMASPASPIDFSKIPMEIMKVNSMGTWNLLEIAREQGARFLEASTSEVYGDPEIHPQIESYVGHVNTLGPRACYDESKRFAETLTMNFLWQHQVDTRIVRIFNTYGPRMRPNDGRVIPNFINQALEEKDLTVYGDGSQTRSFCYVTDLVEAIHHVLFLGDHLPYNIGNPDEYTIKECAEFIITALGVDSQLAFKELPKDDPKKRRPDISRVQALAGYKPRVTFKEGLDRTSEYFKSL